MQLDELFALCRAYKELETDNSRSSKRECCFKRTEKTYQKNLHDSKSQKIRSKLEVPLYPPSPREKPIDKAVNYLMLFYIQLFTYLNDGYYDIYNSIAEQFHPFSGG